MLCTKKYYNDDCPKIYFKFEGDDDCTDIIEFLNQHQVLYKTRQLYLPSEYDFDRGTRTTQKYMIFDIIGIGDSVFDVPITLSSRGWLLIMKDDVLFIDVSEYSAYQSKVRASAQYQSGASLLEIVITNQRIDIHVRKILYICDEHIEIKIPGQQCTTTINTSNVYGLATTLPQSELVDIILNTSRDWFTKHLYAYYPYPNYYDLNEIKTILHAYNDGSTREGITNPILDTCKSIISKYNTAIDQISKLKEAGDKA